MRRSSSLSILFAFAFFFTTILADNLPIESMNGRYFILETPTQDAFDNTGAEIIQCHGVLDVPIVCSSRPVVGFNETVYSMFSNGCEACSDPSMKCYYELNQCFFYDQKNCTDEYEPVCVITPQGFVQFQNECHACADSDTMFIEGECPRAYQTCKRSIEFSVLDSDEILV